MCKDEGGAYAPKTGFLPSQLRTMPMFNELHDTTAVASPTRGGQILCMPKSKYGVVVEYGIIEYTPLLDSCNLTHKDWARIAGDIRDHFDSYDAFVVLHGTDTMAYTASALSFMLHNLSKTVVITGSQIPVSE